MPRVAFRMKLIPGKEEEYRRRHDEIWPELLAEFKRAGISEYVIYLDSGTNYLFAFQKLDKINIDDKLAQTAIFQKWRSYMKGFLEANPDGSPVKERLDEVFHFGG